MLPFMRKQSRESIVILFIGSVLGLNYPFLDLFDRTWLPLGIPLLYLYLYLAWFLMIVLLIAIVSRSEIGEPERSAPPPEHKLQAGGAERDEVNAGDRRGSS